MAPKNEKVKKKTKISLPGP